MDMEIPFTVRPAAPADHAQVERLLAHAKLTTAGVADALPSFLVAHASGEIVGVAGLERRGGDALLRSVAVDESWRGRGVGHALVERMIGEAQAQGIRALYLLTTTAERWFPQFGFTPIARDSVPTSIRDTAEFRDICPDSATVMVRTMRTG